jgi:hypothetical protein
MATLVALSAGLKEEIVGAVVSVPPVMTERGKALEAEVLPAPVILFPYEVLPLRFHSRMRSIA